jgi:ribosome modulation factor
MVNSKAWLEGKVAGSQGVSKNSNPYRGGQDMESWWNGWEEGQKDLEKDGQSGAFSG